jgi:hypothetical protein
MARIAVTRPELKEKVISAIRQQPGCEGVKEISIAAVEVVDCGSTWRTSIIDSSTAEFDTVYHATTRFTKQYSQVFRLAE